MRNSDIKRIQTNKEKYGKAGTFGSEKSIRNQRKSIFKNHLGITDDEFEYLTDEQIKATYGRFCSMRMRTKILIRIQKHFNLTEDEINNITEDDFNNYKKIVYTEALRVKGRKTAIDYNLGNPDEMTPEELLKLSGYTKGLNASKRTEKQKDNDRRKWKITHFKNYYSGKTDYDKLSNEQIDDLYRNYLNDSGRLEKTTKNGRGGKWNKGWYHSNKFNVDIFYRSSYEKYFLEFCENSDIIKKLEFHLNGIKYIFKNQSHWYFPDFLINETYLVEIKAKYQLKEEQTKAKIQAGIQHCIDKELAYLIITEDNLFGEDLCKLF